MREGFAMNGPGILSAWTLMPLLLAASVLTASAGAGAGATVMREADVVFMYAGEPAHYESYGATWVAWGGGPQPKGVHSTGSFWCLTAGARLLHEDAALRDAVAKDIEGNPIKVPWLLDHAHEGTPTWFGCTNHPAFRKHLKAECRKAMKGGPDGLHIDDPSGVYAPVSYGGGCFCDHCMRVFRAYLKGNDSPRLRKEAGVDNFDGFDYRNVVRRQAKTLAEYRKVQNSLPLRKEFVECQLRLAVDNIRELGELARRVAGKEITLSVNTYYSEPGNHFLAFLPAITHMVAEVVHHAEAGPEKLADVIMAYRQAETVGKPLAATAGGHDWAYVKEKGTVNLVKVWIALSYACGQRLMVPHPKGQWCQTAEKGTHWYAAPVDEFAPLYRFVRKNKELFNGFRTAGPLMPPVEAPKQFDTEDRRRALREALERGDSKPLKAGEPVWVFPRMNEAGKLVVHLVNTDYDREGDRVRPQRNVPVEIPVAAVGRAFSRARLHAYDGNSEEMTVTVGTGGIRLAVPEVRIWGLIEFE